MQDPGDILTLFESRMFELGITQAELGARAFGKADNSAIQSLKKGSSPAFDRVAAMADVLGLELYLGPPRSAAPGFSETSPQSDIAQPSAFRSDYLPIPWHNPTRGAGSSPVAFSQAWMSANALIPDRLSAVVPDSVDIQDHIGGSTLAVIDAKASRRQHFGLWCYSESGRIHLSRLLFDRGSILIMANTNTRPPRLLLDSETTAIQLLGRVVWLGVVPKE